MTFFEREYDKTNIINIYNIIIYIYIIFSGRLSSDAVRMVTVMSKDIKTGSNQILQM